jgi:hypothetical protein
LFGVWFKAAKVTAPPPARSTRITNIMRGIFVLVNGELPDLTRKFFIIKTEAFYVRITTYGFNRYYIYIKKYSSNIDKLKPDF